MTRRVLPQHLKKRINQAHNWKGNRKTDGTFKKSRRGKYNANGREIDGHWFPSKAEGDRYEQLKEMLGQGKIFELELQPEFPFRVNNIVVATYKADFAYRVGEGFRRRKIIEDVKGMEPQVYRLKKKLMAALYPDIRIHELKVPKRGNVSRFRYLTAEEIDTIPPGENEHG